MTGATVYCGAPPFPGALADRFNLDPVLIGALLIVCALHVRANLRGGRDVRLALAGWGLAAAALLSPLCALSVSLFSARVAQHMTLLQFAAPLIAGALPSPSASPKHTITATILFTVLLWFWHMPAPYEATFGSVALYWAMHLSLFGSAVLLWRCLLGQHTPQALLAALVSALQMGLLGAVIALSSWPMYRPHYATTAAWGLTPLADQQLGGMLMWVPGCVPFLYVVMRALAAAWRAADRVAA